MGFRTAVVAYILFAIADIVFVSFSGSLTRARNTMLVIYVLMAVHLFFIVAQAACVFIVISNTYWIAAGEIGKVLSLLKIWLPLWIVRLFLTSFTCIYKNVLSPRHGHRRSWDDGGYIVLVCLDLVFCVVYHLFSVFVFSFLSEKTLYAPYHSQTRGASGVKGTGGGGARGVNAASVTSPIRGGSGGGESSTPSPSFFSGEGGRGTRRFFHFPSTGNVEARAASSVASAISFKNDPTSSQVATKLKLHGTTTNPASNHFAVGSPTSLQEAELPSFLPTRPSQSVHVVPSALSSGGGAGHLPSQQQQQQQQGHRDFGESVPPSRMAFTTASQPQYEDGRHKRLGSQSLTRDLAPLQLQKPKGSTTSPDDPVERFAAAMVASRIGFSTKGYDASKHRFHGVSSSSKATRAVGQVEMPLGPTAAATKDNAHWEVGSSGDGIALRGDPALFEFHRIENATGSSSGTTISTGKTSAVSPLYHIDAETGNVVPFTAAGSASSAMASSEVSQTRLPRDHQPVTWTNVPNASDLACVSARVLRDGSPKKLQTTTIAPNSPHYKSYTQEGTEKDKHVTIRVHLPAHSCGDSGADNAADKGDGSGVYDRTIDAAKATSVPRPASPLLPPGARAPCSPTTRNRVTFVPHHQNSSGDTGLPGGERSRGRGSTAAEDSNPAEDDDSAAQGRSRQQRGGGGRERDAFHNAAYNPLRLH